MSYKLNVAALSAKITAAEDHLKTPATTYVAMCNKDGVVDMFVRKGGTIATVLTDAGYTNATTIRTSDGVITVWRKAGTAVTVKNWLDGQYTVWTWDDPEDVKFRRYIGA